MKSPRTSVIAITLCLALTWGFGQQPTSEDSLNWVRPPLKAGTVARQLVAGTVGGAAGYVVVGFITALAGGDGPFTGDGGHGGQLPGIVLGITSGTTSGVFAVGQTDSTTGSVMAAGIGSFAGILLLAPYPTEIINSVWKLPFASAVGATFLFNLTRHYRQPSNADATKADDGAKLQTGSQPQRGMP